MNTENMNTESNTDTTAALIIKKSKTFEEGGETFHITATARLDDDCGNGHEDFSITADIDHKRKSGKWEDWSGGCLHKEIAQHFPELAFMIPLHLSDFRGVPMHCVANGRYWIAEGNDEHAKNTLRISQEELNALKPYANDGDAFFNYHLEKTGLRARYGEQAAAAIAQLEEMTGKKFQSQATRLTGWEELAPEQSAKIAELEASGYFTPEAAAKRAEDKERARIEKLLDDAERDLKKATKKARDKYLFERATIYTTGGAGYASNVIFYDHTREIVGNWHDGSKKWTPEAFEVFEREMRAHKLPEGVTFTLKK